MSARQERINQDILRPKVQRLVTPKKARKVFNKSIEKLAEDAYVKILKRRILIWMIIAAIGWLGLIGAIVYR